VASPEKKADHYLAIHEGQEHALELRENGSESSHVLTFDGQPHTIDAVFLEGGTWSLLIDGESYEVDIDADATKAERLTVAVRGHRFAVEVLDEHRQRMRSASGGFEVEGRAEVLAPMPGKVVKVLVAVGDSVAEGEGLLVVEAMKMENELKAPKDGTVAEVRVEAGDTVDGGLCLAVIE